MTDIDFKQVIQDMLHSMKDIVGVQIKEVKNIATGELLDFAKRTVELGEKVNRGEISEQQAKAILRIRQNAVETVLLSVSGIGLIAAQQAINAAIDVLTGVIKKAIPGVNLF